MFGKGPTGTSKVVGKLWDCAIINQQIGEATVIDGVQWFRISEQDGSSGKTESALIFKGPWWVPPGTEIELPESTRQMHVVWKGHAQLVALGGGDTTYTVHRLSGVRFFPEMVNHPPYSFTQPQESPNNFFITSFIDEDTIVVDYDILLAAADFENDYYIHSTVTETSGGNNITYVPNFGLGDVDLSPTGEATRLKWKTGYYVFDDWILDRPIMIHGGMYTVTRIVNTKEIGFWPPFAAPKDSVAWSIAS